MKESKDEPINDNDASFSHSPLFSSMRKDNLRDSLKIKKGFLPLEIEDLDELENGKRQTEIPGTTSTLPNHNNNDSNYLENPQHSGSSEELEEQTLVVHDLRRRCFFMFEKRVVYTSLLAVLILIFLFGLPSRNSNPQNSSQSTSSLSIYIEDDYVTYPYFNHTYYQKNSFNLLLFGDSLVNIPWVYYNLHDLLYHDIQNAIFNTKNVMTGESNYQQVLLETPPLLFNITIDELAVGGATIQKIRDRLPLIWQQPRKYDGIILFWDSDLSDQSVELLKQTSTKQQYQESVQYVLSFLQQSIPFVSFAGPELLGEGSIFLESRFKGKEELLAEYQQFNQQIGRQLGVPYLNIRKGFLEILPSYWTFSFGYVTTDGEHPNQYGTEIIAKYFETQFMKWFDNKN